jgi:hypothetical protein
VRVRVKVRVRVGVRDGVSVRLSVGVKVTARKVEIEHSTQAQDVFLWGLFFRHVRL